ncbi:MAG: hypothetical protein U0414_23055, partial [Polyangiaceae bacterium]
MAQTGLFPFMPGAMCRLRANAASADAAATTSSAFGALRDQVTSSVPRTVVMARPRRCPGAPSRGHR